MWTLVRGRSERRGALAVVVTVLVLTLVAAACGGDDGGDPKRTLGEAVSAQLDAPHQSVTLSVRAPDLDLSGETDPETADALGELINALALRVRWSAVDEDVEDPFAAAATEFAVLSGDDALLRLRLVEGQVFLAVAVDRVVELVSMAAGEEVGAQLSEARAFLGGLIEPETVDHFFEGRWTAFSGLDEEMLGAASGGQADLSELFSPGLDEEGNERLNDFYSEEVEVTDEGSSDGERQLRARTTVRALAELFADLEELAGEASPMDAGMDPLSEVPEEARDEEVWADAFVADGELRRVEVPVGEILEGLLEAGGEDAELEDLRAQGLASLVVVAEVSVEDGPVTAPSDVRTVDLEKLMGLFFGGLMGPGPDGGAPASPEEQLEDLEDLEEFEEEFEGAEG